ncbi:hypothetical protein ACTFIY_010170 [Dictyostelium cf. discoideum]
MEMFTLLKDSSISPTPSSTSSSSSTFFSNCKRKSISSSPSTMTTTKTMNILPTNKKLPTLQIVPDKDNCENESDQEIELNKCNKKLKLTLPPPPLQPPEQQPEVSKSQPIDNFKMYKEIQEKHVKEWDWKAAAQVHYSDNVHSKFLKPSTKSTNKSTNKSSSSSSKSQQTSITTASTSIASTTTTTTTPILEQTVIDAGQKNVGQMVCSKCKMLYSYGSKEDEAAHQSFCNGNIQQQKVIIKNWQSMKIVNTFPNGRSIIVVTKDNISNNSALSSKINLLKEIINIELGYASPSSSSNVNNNNNNNNNDNDDDDDNEEKLFLYLDSNGRVLGCLIAERVEKGYKIESSSPTIQCSKVPTKILCGINRIWVLPSSRKRGIASKLMESLASNMYYCYHLKKHEIATTQPSTTGLLFFNNYFKTNQFLLYNINQ